MTPEMLVAVLAGIGTIIGALGTFTANRSKKTAEDVKILATRVRSFERRDLAHTQHMFVLERTIVNLNGQVPPRPPIIENPLEDDDE